MLVIFSSFVSLAKLCTDGMWLVLIIRRRRLILIHLDHRKALGGHRKAEEKRASPDILLPIHLPDTPLISFISVSIAAF